MERLEADDAGLAKVFVAIKGPGSLQLLPEMLFVLLQTRGREEVLAVERVFQAEEVENGREEVASVLVGKVADEGHVRPELILCDDFVEIQVVDHEQAALLEIGKHDSPTATEIGDGSIEEVGLKSLLVARRTVASAGSSSRLPKSQNGRASALKTASPMFA